MKGQDKQAEINLSRGEFRQGSWEDSNLQREARRKQLRLLQPVPAQNQLILDAGCGPGTYGVILAQQGNTVIGIDISPEAAQVVRERAIKENVTMLPAIGDLEWLPFKDNSFDTCFCGFTLHHFPDIQPVVIELARVLKPGGKIFIAEPNASNPLVLLSACIKRLLRGWLATSTLDTPNEVIHKIEVYTRVLEQQGFSDIKVSSCFPGGLPPLPSRDQQGGLKRLSVLFIHVLVRLRRLVFIVADKVLPEPLNGADLLITATKKQTKN